MKRMIAVMCIALAGCVSPPKVDMALQQINEYGTTSSAEAERGAISWESRYIRLFEIAAGIENQILRSGYRKGYSDIIPVARRFDAQQITRQEFDDARRGLRLSMEAIDDEARRVQAAQAQARNAQIEQAQREYQARQNQIYQEQMRAITRPQTNCTSSIYGNTMQTNCR